MEPLHVVHLILVAFWGGLVVAETVVEMVLREGEAARLGAEVHYWIDLLVEGPILVAIVVTGGVLLSRAWPPTPLHVVKIALALTAIGVNFWCVGIVIRRRHQTDARAVESSRQRVLWTGVGIPFAVAAMYIGLHWFT
jgi:hypothetical protein